ncbi:MAG: cadherin domain-containing protein, partial [Hyphomicrobiaceae bacterium]|nr:cadherin domain-containing protein [Hyphomicrobiaceae bacterium]
MEKTPENTNAEPVSFEALDGAPHDDGIADELRRRTSRANDVRAGTEGSQRQEMVLSNVMLMSNAERSLAGITEISGGAPTADELATAQAFANLTSAVLRLSDEDNQAANLAFTNAASRGLGSSGPGDAFFPFPSNAFDPPATSEARSASTPASVIFEPNQSFQAGNTTARSAPSDSEAVDLAPQPASPEGSATPPTGEPAEPAEPSTPANAPPVVSSPAAAAVSENATGTVYTATATDPDSGTTLRYSLSGADAALFNINSQTGEISFTQSPDYESPADAGGNNVYDVKVTATDGTNTATKDVAITVTNTNEGPAITSAAAATAAENGTGVVYTATATDPDAGTTLTYSLSGVDAALFNIDPATGEVSFKQSPDYETPQDADGDNVYDVKVIASDGTNSASEDVAITVTNVEGLVLTSTTATSVAENATGTVYTATSVNESGAPITYTLSGNDAALFNIDPATGEVSFKQSPDYETPQDADGDNIYDIKVTASDGTSTASEDVAITVSNGNEGPTVTSAAAVSVAENTAGTVYTATATDPDAGTTLTYSLSGADAALFNIDATTGAMSFKQRPDYENAQDAGADNIYDVKVTASDGTNATTQDVKITVINTNEGPTVTSAAAVSVAENTAGVVYTATATDPDAGTTLTYTLSGADAALFNIDASTGAVSFKTAPNYENAKDAGANNIYDVKVTASDGTNATTQDVEITVTNTNEGPMVTSAAAVSVAENTAGTVYAATATDPDAGTTLTYSLSGADAALFNIDVSTGAVSFKTAPNYENAKDAGANNIYDVKVTASDGTNATTQDVAITVTNINEGPTLSVSGNAIASVVAVSEFETGNSANQYLSINGTTLDGWSLKSGSGLETVGSRFYGTNNAGHGNAMDLAGNGADNTIQRDFTGLEPNQSYVFTMRASSGGSDGTAFFDENGIDVTINGVTSTITPGDLVKGYQTFTFAFKTDANGNAHVEVAGTDATADRAGAFIDTLTVLKGTTSNFSPILEGAANGSIVGTASATDPDAGETLTYSLVDNAGGRFAIDARTGVITVADGSKLDYEASASHTIAVKVTDAGGLSSQQNVTIAIADKPPVFVGNGTASVAENTTGTVYNAAARDGDTGSTITYTLSGGDAALFNINAQTGAISFKSTPNYENPRDAGGDNVYDVKVTASNRTTATTQDVVITVTNTNEGPAVTSAAAVSVAENTTGTVYTATATDPDAGTTLTYSLSGADAALFNIDASTGAVSFKGAPNYESPADAGADNVYDVKVTASDGTNAATQDVKITVANTNEGPTVTSAAAVSVAEN